jgi:hypothetical protein
MPSPTASTTRLGTFAADGLSHQRAVTCPVNGVRCKSTASELGRSPGGRPATHDDHRAHHRCARRGCPGQLGRGWGVALGLAAA